MVSAREAKTALPRRARVGPAGARRPARRCCSGSGRATRTRARGRSPAGRSTRTSRSSSRSAATSPPRSTCASSPISSSSRRAATPTATRSRWELATAYLGLVPSDLDPAVPRRHALASGRRPAAARLRPRADRRSPRASACARSSPTRTSASRSRPTTFTISELRDLYLAALGHDVSADEPAPRPAAPRRSSSPPAQRRDPGREGGRPAALFRFRDARHSRSPTSSPFFALRPAADRRGQRPASSSASDLVLRTSERVACPARAVCTESSMLARPRVECASVEHTIRTPASTAACTCSLLRSSRAGRPFTSSATLSPARPRSSPPGRARSRVDGR